MTLEKVKDHLVNINRITFDENAFTQKFLDQLPHLFPSRRGFTLRKCVPLNNSDFLAPLEGRSNLRELDLTETPTVKDSDFAKLIDSLPDGQLETLRFVWCPEPYAKKFNIELK